LPGNLFPEEEFGWQGIHSLTKGKVVRGFIARIKEVQSEDFFNLI